MDSVTLRVSDRVVSAVSELRRQNLGLDDQDHYMNEFVDGIKALTRFVHFIRMSDSLEVAPHLESLVTKTEASIRKIGGEFQKKMKRDKWASRFKVVSFNLWETNLEKEAQEWINVFKKLNNVIDPLKKEIAESCDSLSIHSVRCRSPMHDFKKWKNFFRAVSGMDETLAIMLTVDLLDSLAYYHLNDPIIEDFLFKLGGAVISAALLSCQYWASNLNDMSAALQDLKQKVCFTNTEFVDFIFRILKVRYYSVNFEDFSRRLIPFDVPMKICSLLRRELISLLKSALKGSGKDAQMFLSDTKLLLVEIASVYHSLYDLRDRSVAADLLEKIWLIKIEIFLRAQLTADNIILVEKEGLNQIIDLRCAAKLMRRATETRNPILMLMEEVAEQLAAPEISVQDKEKVRDLILKLLLKTLFFKAKLVFLKLHDNLVVSLKDPIESLHDGLKIIIPAVLNQSPQDLKGGKLEFSQIEVVATGIISIYHLILTRNISEERLKDIYPLLSDLLNEITLTMKELRNIYPSVQRPNPPKTNAVGFINCLLTKLSELPNYKADLVESVITTGQIAEIMGHLEFFQSFLEEDIMFQELKNLRERVINVSYEVDYLIDSMIFGKEAEWHKMIWRYNFLEDIRDIKIQVSENQGKRTDRTNFHNSAHTNRHMISRSTTPNIDEDVVSLVDQEELIIDRLIGGFDHLYIVSIVGMPGIGKTTLAKKVYNSPEVVSQFRIRAWCCVSEIYGKREVLLEILSHIIAFTGNIMGMPAEELEFMLYKILKTHRYLIVFDDVWDTDVLDDLVRRFPDNGDKGRILMTSRYHHVALKANPNGDATNLNPNPHHLRQLSDSESWKLLQKKVFHGERCPEELKEIGEKIARSCKGLPLAIVAMAGLLERIERQHNWWKEIAESLSSQIIDDPQEPWRHILELSYEHLPDCLKACFLYFGAFLEDQDIPAKKLMRLWIAEGFVQKTDVRSFEDIAEDYLMDLIGRSLVMLSQHRSRGGPKACRVHDVLRKLCQSKAKEDKFLQVVTLSNESNAPLHDLDYVFSANFGNPSSSVTYVDHRICFCSTRKHFIDSRPSGPHVRSLLCFATDDKDPRCPYDISFIFDNFRFLKVLDLECINMGNFFLEGIEVLVLLRYLAVAGYIDSVPSSIGRLWNLEILIVKGLRDKVKVNLPRTIWCLKRLRHVHVRDFAAISLQDYELGNSSQLDYLVTISSLFLPFGEDTCYILKQFPNLKKLKCIFSESQDASQNYNHFPNLEVLNKLESLKITYYGRVVHPGEFSFPLNLNKLTLSNFRLSWDKISVIGQLPNLEVMKLLSRAFVGEEWEMVEGEFLKLKYMKLENLDFAKWNVSSDHLPKLEKLVLKSCGNLEIPVDIEEIPTLQMIDVQWCGDLVEKSVRQIREVGDEKLKVFINFAELQFPST